MMKFSIVEYQLYKYMIAFVLFLWVHVLALESANQEARNRAKNS